MDVMDTFELPKSGLAEDILARFMEQAQQEVDTAGEKAEAKEGDTLFHLVTFFLGREEYGVDIATVQEIIRATDITPVPGSPPHVRGVLNLRGKIIPVVDLRARFGLPESAASDARRIVVTELGTRRIGMLVDSVSQVLKFSSTLVEEIPEEATTVADNYIHGIAKLDNRLIVILDLKQSLLAL
jgi:purine-binding chemotaxis protein CheW